METKVLDECQNRQNCWMNTKQATRTVEIDQDLLAVKNQKFWKVRSIFQLKFWRGESPVALRPHHLKT